MAGTIEARFDLTGAIIAFEAGELDHDGELELLQHLLDTGLYQHLQGSYGRAVQRALDSGDISPTIAPVADWVPSTLCIECGRETGHDERCTTQRSDTTRTELGEDYDTVKHFAQSNPTDDAVSLAELVSAKLGIELTTAQAADIYKATV